MPPSQEVTNKTICVVVGLAAVNTCLAQDLNNETKVFTPASEVSPADWSSVHEMERTWQAAVVSFPGKNGGPNRTTISELSDELLDSESSLPTVIYMHGCSGFWSGTYQRMNFLAANGFLVIAPASFARKKYPQSCDTKTHEAGLYRGTLNMRQFDAGRTIEKARKLPFVDQGNIFLMGLSQGGVTTATFKPENRNQRVKARVIEGWTCNAGWSEYAGLNADETEPVLSLLSDNDPWFQDAWLQGDCGEFMTEGNGSRSIVYTEAELAGVHELLDYERPRMEVIEFLRAQTTR